MTLSYSPVHDDCAAAKPIDLGEAQVLNVSQRGDGRQKILKVACDTGFIILKCYGLKRTRLRALVRQFGSFFLIKKSSVTARGRRATEIAVMTLWKREGFDVPTLYDLPELPPDFPCCIAMEWIPGPTLVETLRDENNSLDFKKEIIARYAGLWAKRHARAIELNEPRLLQENPTLSHVFYSDGRLVHFDFEIVFTWKKDMERLIRREIVGVVHSLAKAGREHFEPLLNTLLDNYPELSHFRQAVAELERYGTVPEVGWSAVLHLLTRRRNRYLKRQYFTDILDRALKKRP